MNFRGIKYVLIFDFMIFQKLGEFTRFSPGFHQIFKVHRIFAKEKFGEFIRFSSDFQILLNFYQTKIRRRMARERRGAESSVVSMETLYYKIIY